MNEELVYRGEWFLPSVKNKRVSGIMTYNPSKGCELELFGSFNDGIVSSVNNESIIQGLTSDSREITLYQCFVTKVDGGRSVRDVEFGKPTISYSALYILDGVHIDNKEDLLFQTLACEIQNLDEWVGISGFVLNHGQVYTGNGIDIHFDVPKPIKFKINETFDGELCFVLKGYEISHFQRGVNLNQHVQLRIYSKDEVSLDSLLKTMTLFQNFLILAMYKRTYTTSIYLYNEKFHTKFGEEFKLKKQIQLLFSISSIGKPNKTKSFHEMLFCYENIKEDFSRIISAWYRKYELLEPALNLLFEQFYNSERFTVNSFLNLAQSAETFHARIDNHTRMPGDSFQTMKKDIISLTPTKYHGWLKDQFNFGNNLNLHSRLTDIVEKYSNSILDLAITDKVIFVNQVKWSRNYYTHYSAGGKKKALKNRELFELTAKLKLLLVCAFLIESGFDKDLLEKLLIKHKYSVTNFYSI